MAISPLVKTFVPQLAALVRHMCHYILKYQGTIVATIGSVVTDETDKAILLAFITSVNAACVVFNKYWPPEAS